MADEKKLTDEVRAALEAQAQGLPPVLVEREKQYVEEWGVWVAAQPIDYGGARAYNTGHAVPKANVERYHYDELGWVVRRSTKEGKAALAESGVFPEGVK